MAEFDPAVWFALWITAAALAFSVAGVLRFSAYRSRTAPRRARDKHLKRQAYHEAEVNHYRRIIRARHLSMEESEDLATHEAGHLYNTRWLEENRG